ncbi:hypothetical protein ACF08E_10600 [Streptomyces globisporus]|uniref:hypothetical protein n=1 Tax=Streptomyces globisporus TaxID=1908 RepID=UPI0037014B20
MTPRPAAALPGTDHQTDHILARVPAGGKKQVTQSVFRQLHEEPLIKDGRHAPR